MVSKVLSNPLFAKYCDHASRDTSNRVYKRWEHLFKTCGFDYSMYRTIEMHRLLKDGVPYEYKAQVWGACSGAMTEMILNPGEYAELLARSTRLDAIHFEEIERDLYRFIDFCFLLKIHFLFLD